MPAQGAGKRDFCCRGDWRCDNPNTAASDRLSKLYGELASSLDMITATLDAAGVNPEKPSARDLYERNLDCQNLGAHAMLERLAAVAAEDSPLGSDETLLDIGCGIGGPGRFLADRFSCSVVGIDLVPRRTEVAKTLTDLTGMSGRVSYRVADATDLPFDDGAFDQAWMLDVGIHIRDKRALFGEIARVLRPGGLLVMHDQMGPLPQAMRPMTRRVPYIAPSLPQLLRYVDGAGLRVLTWRDTTHHVLDYFDPMKTALSKAQAGGDGAASWWKAAVDGYVETLANLGGRTGILTARRVEG